MAFFPWRGSNGQDAQRALRILELLEELRQNEGATVTFCCDNVEFNQLPNCCVSVCDYWTNWIDKEFRADTLEQCMVAAVNAKRKAEGTR